MLFNFIRVQGFTYCFLFYQTLKTANKVNMHLFFLILYCLFVNFLLKILILRTLIFNAFKNYVKLTLRLQLNPYDVLKMAE